MEIRPITQEEWKYTYRQSSQLQGQTGSIGYLRGDFGRTGREFYTTWQDHRKQWKTDAFREGLDEVINALRSEEYGLLTSRGKMKDYTVQSPGSAFQSDRGTEYGFRVNLREHVFLLRCNPAEGDYNFYCFCYVKEWLDRHMGRARQGIRFIDPHYKELFCIPDGGRITVTDSCGEKHSRTCRYIDEYHTEVNSQIYHICEFAERMEGAGMAYEPDVQGQKGQKAPKHKDRER